MNLVVPRKGDVDRNGGGNGSFKKGNVVPRKGDVDRNIVEIHPDGRV